MNEKHKLTCRISNAEAIVKQRTLPDAPIFKCERERKIKVYLCISTQNKYHLSMNTVSSRIIAKHVQSGLLLTRKQTNFMSIKYVQIVQICWCDHSQQRATSNILGENVSIHPFLDFNGNSW